MQEIKKRRIVLASVLKPVDDTRMFEKLGRALSPHAHVSIIGYPTTAIVENADISLYPHKPFRRLSLNRLLTPWRILFKMWSLRPDIIIITTHELLFQAWVLKAFRRVSVYYDVQENYSLNILHTDAFPVVLRGLIATYVRMKESVFGLFVDRFILAEEVYTRQLPFANRRSVVIENKAAGGLSEPRIYGAPVRFLFTGTLARTTGVLEAIQLVGMLYESNPEITLTIAGYSPNSEEFRILSAAVTGKSYIRMIGGDKLIPHQQIVELIRTADVGIICYPPNIASEGRRPTKLYEYLAFRLPILACSGPDWTEWIHRYNAGVVYDQDNFSAAKILHNLSKTPFYPTFPVEATWDKEVSRLLKIFGYSNPG